MLVLYWAPFFLIFFINDFFIFSAKCEICNFPDDNSLYSCGMNLDHMFSELIQDVQSVYEWFVYNSMRVNPDKFQFIILGNTGSHTLQTGLICWHQPHLLYYLVLLLIQIEL